ncbi:MAG: SpoIIE family protein phosphatase [Candidatus Sericytochromatia bacterium]
MDQILIIEDDPAIQGLLCRFLSKAGYQVTAVETLKTGQEALQRGEFDLVLLDINLPDGNGLTLLPHFDLGDPPVVMLTADNQCLEQAFALGATDYLLKPFLKGELLARVQHIISHRRLRLEREKQLLELQADLSLAAQVQQLSLPPAQPATANLNLDWLYQPLNQVSGDLLSVYEPSAQTRLFCLADVSGHGLAAALVMMALRNSLESQISQGYTSPWQIMRALSERMSALLENHYITLVIGHLDLESGDLKLCNSGHPAPLLRRGTDVIALEGKTAMPIGIQSCESLGADFELITQLQAGDQLLLYSDGLFENSRYQSKTGLGALTACFSEQGAGSLPELVAGLHGQTPLKDDLSALMIALTALTFSAEVEVTPAALDDLFSDLHLWLLQNQVTDTQIQKIQLLWLEATNNLLSHSQATQLQVMASLNPQGVDLSLSDNGQPWTPNVELTCPSAQAESGRGLWLMQALCETLQIERRQTQNHVLMSFHFYAPQEIYSHV